MHTPQPELAEALAALWNAALPDHPVTPPAVLQRLGADADRQLIERDGRLVAAVEVAPPGKPWDPQGTLGHVRYLLVHPDAQGQGLGARLLGWAEARLRGAGADSVAPGEEPDHFFPGPPPAALGYFERHGYRATERHSVDLKRDLTDLPPAPHVPGARFALGSEPGIAQAVDGFLAEVFPGRWRHDAARTAGRDPTQLLALMRGDTARGFALIGAETDHVTLPSFLWARALTPGVAGGLGPMGVHPDERGGGVGRALLHAAMHELARRGVQVMGVDWTGVAPFYEKSGFTVWREYRHARKEL